MKKTCLIPLGATCRHGYVRKHGKVPAAQGPGRRNHQRRLVGRPYTHVKVKAQANSMSIELNGFPCIDSGAGQFYVETGGGAVTGSLSKSSVSAKGTASGGYSETTTEGSRTFKWDLTGVFTTRGNFSGKLHIVVDETVGSPNVAPSHCDATETYVLGYIK